MRLLKRWRDRLDFVLMRRSCDGVMCIARFHDLDVHALDLAR